MRIDINTTLLEFSAIYSMIDDEQTNAIKKASIKHFVGSSFYELTIAQFTAMIDGDFSDFGIFEISEIKTVFEHYFVIAFSAFVSDFCDAVDKLTVPQKIDEQRASKMCLPVTFAEGLYMFCRDFFNLPSFESVDKLKLADFILAKKQSYNSIVMQNELMKIQQSKIKKH